MRRALEIHDDLLTTAVEEHGGSVFKTVGDAFCAVFPRAMDALTAAVAIQRAVSTHDWSLLCRPIRVKIGIHTGEAQERNSDYYGPALNRVARLQGTAHGSQSIISLVTAELVRDRLPPGIALRELGPHRLKDLARPESVFQIVSPGLPDQFPPLKSLDRHSHNLPVQPNALIGRDEEIATIAELLESDEHPIITITGPGGMGKTRAALQTAAECIESFEDGAFFVDLSRARSGDEVFTAIARVFHVSETGSQSVEEASLAFLERKNLLLVLDNFEQIVDEAQTAARIVGRCPGVRCLVTSRAPLRLRGEAIFDLPPLSMPVRGEPLPSIDQLSQYEAVALFIRRAQALDKGFAVTSVNAPAVAEICFRLDGIPLAIELAAARTRVLKPRALLDRLEHRLRLLTGGARDLPVRQRTLRSTIDWSFDLLDDRLQAAFCALAAFDGLIRLQAAEAVLGGVIGDADALDLLEALVDHSMLTTVPLEEEEPTYAMLDVIHEYAREKLRESEIEESAREAHARFFVELAQAFPGHFFAEDQARWVSRCWSEAQNFAAAIAWMQERDLGEDAFTIVASLRWLYCTKGRGREYLSMLDRFAPVCLEDELRAAEFALCRGSALSSLSELDEAAAHLEQARSVYADCGCSDFHVETTYELARVLLARGELHDADELYRAVEEDARSCAMAPLAQLALHGRGCIAMARGELQSSVDLMTAAHDGFYRSGDRRSAAQVQANLGVAYYRMGDLDRARRAFRDAAGGLSEAGDVANALNVYSNLGFLLRATDDLDEALSVFRSLQSVAQSNVRPEMQAVARSGIADCMLAMHNSGEAQTQAEAAVRIALRTGDTVALGIAHRVYADCLMETGCVSEALDAYTAALPHLEKTGDPEEISRAAAGIRAAEHALEGEGRDVDEDCTRPGSGDDAAGRADRSVDGNFGGGGDE